MFSYGYLLLWMVETDVSEYLKYEMMMTSTREFPKIKSCQIVSHFSEEIKKRRVTRDLVCLECNKTFDIVSHKALC